MLHVHMHAISAIASVLFGLCSPAEAQAADVDLALRLERYRPGFSGPAQWAQLYPVPPRDGLLAGG